MPHGLFSFFKKKPARKTDVREERTTTRQESYCDVNELMPDESAKTQTLPAEAPKSIKSKKKFAAPTAPSKPRAADVVANSVLEESGVPKTESPPRKEEPVKDAPSKQDCIREEVQNSVEDKRTAVPKQKLQSTPDIHVQEVIHYTPQNTIRSSRRPASPSSDMPYIERKSNIILSDKSGLKTIPVSQFDGTISRANEKRAIAPPSENIPPVATNCLLVSSVENNTSSSNGEVIGKEMVIDVPHLNINPQERRTDEDGNEEIAREFETLKAKFELWKALQAANRNSPEAKQLHMEIMYQNESLMKKLQQSTDVSGHPGRNRPSLASDTFTPWLGNKSQPKLSSSQNLRISRTPDNIKRSVHSSRWASTPSSHSLSPATSTSSEETDRSQYSQYEGRQSRSVVTDHYTAVAPDQGFYHVQQSSNDDERARATLRVVEEAKELKRKEQELRRTIGYSVAKETGSPSTSRNFAEHHKSNTITPSTLPKYHHTRGTSDGNNNSINSQRTAQSLFPDSSAPAVAPSRSLYCGSQKFIHSKEYVCGTWSGSLHSSMTSLSARNGETVVLSWGETSAPYQCTARKPSPLAENKKEQAPVPTTNESIAIDKKEPLVVKQGPSKQIPAKLPHLRGNKLWSPSLEEVQEHMSSPPIPDVDSNIRKVKEAVKQQSLGHKSAGNLLLETNFTQLPSNLNARSEPSIPTIADTPLPRIGIGRNSSSDRSHCGIDRVVTNNISTLIKEGPATLRKIGTPVEKSGIRLGKVIEDTFQLDPVKPREVTIGRPEKRKNSSATLSQGATPPPLIAAPPPTAAPPPSAPPPPPPTVLMTPLPKRVPNQRQINSYPQSQITIRDLENQRTKLKPPLMMEKHAMSVDVRDSLMAEIRNAGGIRALKRTSREQ